jgi:hypothetical protein
MKKKKLLIVAVIVLSNIHTIVYSQKINWGQAFIADKNYSPIVIAEEENAFYTSSCSDKELVLEKIDKKKSSVAYSKKYEIPKNQEIELIALAYKKISFFFSYYDSKKKTAELYCNVYSSSDGKITESNHSIASVKAETNGNYKNYDYSLYKSSDNKKILSVNSVYSEKEKKYTTNYILLDQNLSKKTEKSENTGSTALYIAEVIVDNNGSFYFQKRLDGDKFRLASYDADNSYEEYEYVLDDKLKRPKNSELSSSTISFNKNGEVVMIGQYRKDNIFSGYYFICINPQTKQIISSKINEFDEKFINQFRTPHQIEKGKKARVSDYFRNLHLMAKEDGGMIGITDGVQEITTQVRTTNQQGFSTNDRIGDAIIYYDVVTLNFSSDGTLNWANRIPRYQSYSSRRWFSPKKLADYLSSFSVLTNDKLYIAYHDMPANIAIKSDNERIKGFKKMTSKAVIALFTIDLKTGQKDKSQFAEGADLEVFLEPRTAYQESQNSDMIILGSKKTKFKYGIMSFKK